MNYWTIKPLYYGFTSGRTESRIDWEFPWIGFYLTDGKRKILCDTGVKDGFFIDNKSPFGNPSEGDETHVREALNKAGVAPEEIDIVIYTHFHWDHAGNCHLFPQATHVFQDQEWKEMVDPLPSMKFLTVYDQRVIPELEKLTCQRVAGDLAYLDGLELFHVPGHSRGGQCLRVNTREGTYIIAGDLFHTYFLAYPNWDDWTRRDGTKTKLHPDVKNYLTQAFLVTIYDHYAWYESQYRILGMVSSPKFLLPGHDASILGKTYG
ncbi:N-acyl homoserine lactonase family protein [bacterium]|nr:N-acyl homoserine lactonase family protein [bacterium]